MLLNQAKINKPVEIINITLTEKDKMRLWDLGIKEGVKIKILKIAPMGQTYLVESESGIFALRKDICGGVSVRYV